MKRELIGLNFSYKKNVITKRSEDGYNILMRFLNLASKKLQVQLVPIWKARDSLVRTYVLLSNRAN